MNPITRSTFYRRPLPAVLKKLPRSCHPLPDEGPSGSESGGHRLSQEGRCGRQCQGGDEASLACTHYRKTIKNGEHLFDEQYAQGFALSNLRLSIGRDFHFHFRGLDFALYADPRPAEAAPTANSNGSRSRTFPALFRPGSQRSH